jgi:glucosamine--fructose-6-phosphate aminotransferase (isomerizing)
MCGISSFIGDENAYRKILDGLLQLQNRGYDSAGISIFENGNIITHKYASSTNSSALDKLEKYNYENNHVGIGHTRWATHGAKTDTNSHPHMSFNERFVLVHNGIIENFQEIKTFLASKGISCISQTDTEVIVNLLAYYYDDLYDIENATNVVENALKKVIGELKGTWGITILHKDEPNKIYCTRHGSPLLVGIEDNMAMIVSEQSGFCNLFNKYIVLNNHDICVLSFHEEKKLVTINTKDSYDEKSALVSNNALTPAPYPHWTIKEINEQVDSSLRAISLGGRLLSNDEVCLGGLNEKVNDLKNIDNLILLGCGTSYHAGMIGVHYFKEISELNSVQLFDGAEFTKADVPKIGKTALLLLSQSGETKDLHRCIKIAQEYDLYMIGVVNVVDSLIAREVHCGCYLNAGREVAVASTKAYSSQVILLSMIAVWFAQIKGNHDLKRVKIMNDLRKLYLDIEKTIYECESVVKELIPIFEKRQSCFLLGKGKCESIAREGALKIKEISYIHAEGYSTSSLKHGPFALLDEGFPVVLVAPDDDYYYKSMNAYEEIASRHANIIMITDKQDCDKPNCIKVSYNETFRDLLCIIPIQILAYELSLSRGLNPDMPRNLAKVVTVE